MNIDLLAGAATAPRRVPSRRPTILVLDSGLGGLTVLREVMRARPDAEYVYAADDAAFPYGDWAEEPLTRRVADVVGRLVDEHAPDLAVIACNTVSTLVLPALRTRFDIPFVGTVPAIKPAVAASRTGRVTVLATPGTVRRDYTRGLVTAYAGECRVDLVGSPRLAAFAEGKLSGHRAPDEAIRAEIAPCFVDQEGRRTDVVVLACTHYPLLLARMRDLAPWPVTWIDPAPAIARRVDQVLVGPSGRPAEPGLPGEAVAVFTGDMRVSPELRRALRGCGLGTVRTGCFPLPHH